MSDKRPMSEFRFGQEWSPKLAEIMLQHPWQDSEFRMADPSEVCKICGRALGSVNHAVENKDVSRHNFVPTTAWTADQIKASRDEWRLRMAGLPTEEALTAWKTIHEPRIIRLFALFDLCQVKTRDDIEELGCTGCTSYGLSIDDIQFMRVGLAGSGVGLPCFVPPDRYCVAHGVSGGLQDGQTVRWGEFVDKVARPLTPAEQAHDKLVSAARKSEREHGAHSLLHGHTMPAGWHEVEEADGVVGGAQIEETLAEAVEGLRAEGGIDDIVKCGTMRFQWRCDEHDKTDWGCRQCVAQAVVEGELMPVCVLRVEHPTSESGFTPEFDGSVVEKEIADEDTANSNSVKLYVRVATFTRKLARD
jgi:hypothetical protein